MKKTTGKIFTLIIALMLLTFTATLTACGKKYTCDWCGKRVSVAYYDPFDTDEVMCEDCAKQYFAPLPYSAYRIH